MSYRVTIEGLPRTITNYKEVRKHSFLEPLKGGCSCQHLEFVLLTSRTVREKNCYFKPLNLNVTEALKN